jgi:integrase/recombinase XerD
MGRRRTLPRVMPGDPQDPKGLHALVLRHLDWMRQQNFSPRTIENRQKYMGFFVAWCYERGITRATAATKPVLERYKRWLYHYRKPDGKPLSFRSQHVRLTILRSFFRWAARHNHVPWNPASELELPKLERRLPRAIFTPEEAEQVLALPDVTTVTGLRDRAILETFYSTGIRRQECIDLTVFCVDAARGVLSIRQGKGKKDRFAPIGERALAWVQKYLSDARPQLVRGHDGGTLFLTHLGDKFTPVHMSQLSRAYIVEADLGKTGSCHIWRHSAATALLEAGMDLRHLQAFLSHEKLSTVAIYTHVGIARLKELHQAMHPTAALRRSGATPAAGDDLISEDVLALLEAEAEEE